MFDRDDIHFMFDEIVDDHPEERAYHEGVAQAAAAAETRQLIADIARENYNRGHNAGYACGIMLAVLADARLRADPRLERSVGALVESIAQLKVGGGAIRAARRNNDDDDDASGGGASVVDADKDDDGRDVKGDFRQRLVGVVGEFVQLVRSAAASTRDLAVEHIMPAGAWEFVVQLVDDNAAGAPGDEESNNPVALALREDAEEQQRRRLADRNVNRGGKRANNAGGGGGGAGGTLDW